MMAIPFKPLSTETRPRSTSLRHGLRMALAACLLAAVPALAQPPARMLVRYPKQESANSYPLEVLKLALQESGLSYTLEAVDAHMTQSRALQQLAKGESVDVAWSMTSQEREAILRPIRIPIDKGLLGWRLLLTNQAGAPGIAKIRTLDGLRKLQAGQGHDWPDTDILRYNGLPVQVSTSYDGLFKMLEAGRFDYFPRSVIEIWDEQKNFGDQKLEINKNLVLYYPTAFYFFVNLDDRHLAHTIENGLNKAIANGKFEQLFQQTYGEILKRANLKGRHRFDLYNPLLPLATPLARKELWITF